MWGSTVCVCKHWVTTYSRVMHTHSYDHLARIVKASQASWPKAAEYVEYREPNVRWRFGMVITVRSVPSNSLWGGAKQGVNLLYII